jgi:hypothetical protein
VKGEFIVNIGDSIIGANGERWNDEALICAIVTL